jgi:sterol desaturase/sphingolipid hydroxylase (fatty acid hydroxylase superfamily)
MPNENWIFKIPFLKAAKAHHKLHHNTKLMRNWNFNIGLPLCDVLFKTYRKE